MQTTGGECTLGGGGDGDGGNGGDGGSGSDYGKKWVSFNDSGYEHVSTTLSKLNENLGKQLVDINGRSARMYDSLSTNTHTALKELQESYKTNDILNDALPYIKQTAGSTSGTNLYLSRMESLLAGASFNLKNIADIVGNGSTGSSSGAVSTADLSAIKGDVASLKAMQQSAMSTLGSIGGNTSSMSSNMGSMLGAIGSLQGSVNSVNSNISSQSGYLSQMNDNLYGIKYMLQDGLKNGWGNSGGGQGGSGDFNIDYSQMPGSGSNPLHVAGSEYNSTLCSGDASCAFDLEQITKKYDEEKEALKSQYLAIKGEMADIFRFDFYGSASVPKCFDMFSLFGNDYQVCPNVGGYWEILLALMLFIFYFIAFMIVAKR
ncbi:hypothetical protein QO202_22525 [Aeromonas caviae]|uniref:hypothetical protein n=1 Tax=Aeromonas caviae TaxID=648 RepID=UPI002647717E|nr:hypothetical protein [Aeromonas caviae]MDN6870763.1 hypothetical protein [Aeromonas caviae]